MFKVIFLILLCLCVSSLQADDMWARLFQYQNSDGNWVEVSVDASGEVMLLNGDEKIRRVGLKKPAEDLIFRLYTECVRLHLSEKEGLVEWSGPYPDNTVGVIYQHHSFVVQASDQTSFDILRKIVLDWVRQYR